MGGIGVRLGLGVLLAVVFAAGLGTPTPQATAQEPSGTITTVAGTPQTPLTAIRALNALAVETTISDPQDVVVDAAGDVYVAEWNCYVSKIADGTISVVASSGGGCNNGFSADSPPPTSTRARYPHALAFDRNGDLLIGSGCFVLRLVDGTIETITGRIQGNVTCAGGEFGEGGPAAGGGLNDASGLAVDDAGNIYIADVGACRVHQIAAADGIIRTVAGTGTCGYGGDGGPATAALLNSPWGIVTDNAGALYIADRSNCRVRKVSDGTITTVAGSEGCIPFQDAGDGGPAVSASLASPIGLAFDPAGNLHISEVGGCRVRKVVDGIITTVAGTGECGFAGDGGPATEAKLNAPIGITFDDSGNLYIADSRNVRVRMVAFATAAAAEPYRPSMVRAVGTPLDLSTDPDVIATNVSFAVITLLVILLSAQLFNATLTDNRAEIEARIGPWLRAFAGVTKWVPAWANPATPPSPKAGALGLATAAFWVVVVLGLTVVIYGFSEPGFGPNAKSAVLALSLIMTVGFVTYFTEGWKAHIGRTQYGQNASVRPVLIAIAIAVVNVLICRAVGFGPGVIFGFVGACVFLKGPPRLNDEQQGKTTLPPTIGLLAAALIAWALAIPLRELATATDMAFTAFLEGVVVTLFVAGLQGTFFSMIPLRFMEGQKILSWRRVAWVVLFALSGLLFWWVLVNPDGSYLDALTATASIAAFAIMGTAAVFSVCFWVFFTFGPTKMQTETPGVPGG